MLRGAAATVRGLVADRLLGLLEEREPGELKVVQDVLSILLYTGKADSAKLLELVAGRSRVHWGGRDRFFLWWNAWFALDEPGAVDSLESQLAGEEPEEVERLGVIGIDFTLSA